MTFETCFASYRGSDERWNKHLQYVCRRAATINQLICICLTTDISPYRFLFQSQNMQALLSTIHGEMLISGQPDIAMIRTCHPDIAIRLSIQKKRTVPSRRWAKTANSYFSQHCTLQKLDPFFLFLSLTNFIVLQPNLVLFPSYYTFTRKLSNNSDNSSAWYKSLFVQTHLDKQY